MIMCVRLLESFENECVGNVFYYLLDKRAVAIGGLTMGADPL